MTSSCNHIKRLALLGTASTAALLLPVASAYGQSTPNQGREISDEVVVTGAWIKDSQAAAIAAKREAPNVVDIISSDTIGRFPDQNLADSLGRLPGLAIERDQGQARYINFRGAPRRYTTIAFDGIQVPGAENGRIPRFDSIPSVITSQIEANKAITPDMPGDAVAGFINIKTTSPFDREGFSLSGEAGFGVQELGNGDNLKLNGKAVWSSENFGFVIFGSHNMREQITDNREYDINFSNPQSPQIATTEFRNYYVDRQDNAYGGTIEFRSNSGESRIFASTIFSEFIDDEQRFQHNFTFVDPTTFGDQPVALGSAGFTGVLADLSLQEGRYSNSTWTNTIGGDFSEGDWLIQVRGNYTQTRNDTDLVLPTRRGAAALGEYDLSNPEDPLLTVLDFTTQPLSLNDLNYAIDIGILVGLKLDNDALKYKIDAERELDLFNRDVTLKVGAQYDTRDAEGYGLVTELEFALSALVDIDAFETNNTWDTDFTNSIEGTYFDNIGVVEGWEQSVGGFDPITPSPDQIIRIDEDIWSAYAMSTVDMNWGNFVFGARVEATDFMASGSVLDSTTGTLSPVSSSKDYVNVMPSAHANFDLSDDLKLRFSASTGVSRPTYSEARASVALVDPTATQIEIAGGNPDLDAEYAYGGDVSLEYYFDSASIFSIGAFHRNIDNVIYGATQTIADGSIVAPGLISAGTPTEFSSFFNGRDGRLTGVEANFIGYAADILPEPFDGLGISTNITLLDSEFKTIDGQKFSLPGTSEFIFGGSVFFEKFGFSARVNYQYRDAWLSVTEDASGGEFWDAQERLDASLRYQLPWTPGGANVSLFANANNLTDAIDVRYSQTPMTPNQVEGYGRRFMAGFRFDY